MNITNKIYDLFLELVNDLSYLQFQNGHILLLLGMFLPLQVQLTLHFCRHGIDWPLDTFLAF